MSYLFLGQAAGLGLGGSVGDAQQAAHDSGGHSVAHSGHETLCKQLVQRLVVHKNVQHGSHNAPAEDVSNDLGDVELHETLLAHLSLVHLEGLGSEAHQQTEHAGSDDPAPPHAPAVAEVDEGMTDEAHESAGDGAEHHGHEGQQTVLHADIDIGHGAGDRHETAQNEEQRCTDADGNDGLNRKLLHDDIPP